MTRFLSFFALTFIMAAPALAAEVYTITIKDHKFSPETLEVPADTKFTLKVVNADPTPEEFESHELDREKVIQGGATETILLGPLKAGSYPYFGEFNMDTAKGTIVAK